MKESVTRAYRYMKLAPVAPNSYHLPQIDAQAGSRGLHYSSEISKRKAYQARLKESISQLKTTRWGPEAATQVALPKGCICIARLRHAHPPARVQHHASRLVKVDPHSRAATPASCPTAARPCGGELSRRCLPSLGLPSSSVQEAPRSHLTAGCPV